MKRLRREEIKASKLFDHLKKNAVNFECNFYLTVISQCKHTQRRKSDNT